MPRAEPGAEDLLLLADAQTSGGLLVAGEIPGAAAIGELVPRRESVLRGNCPASSRRTSATSVSTSSAYILVAPIAVILDKRIGRGNPTSGGTARRHRPAPTGTAAIAKNINSL